VSREGSFGENAAWSVLAWVVPSIAAFASVPIMVRGLGPDAYGLITLVAALTGYLGLIDLGLGQALVRYLSYYRALDEGRPMRAIVRVSLLWFTAIGAVAGVCLFVAAPWLAKDLLHVSPRLLPTAELVIRLSALNVVPGLLMSVGTAVPVSFLRYDIAAGMTGVFSTAGWIGPAVVVVLGYGIVGITCFYIASNVLAVVLYLYVGRRLFRSVRRDAGPEWRDIRRTVLSFAGLVAVNRIGSTVASQTNRLMVGVVDTTAAAAFYQVPSVLASKVTDLLSRIGLVLFPMGSALIAREDYDGLRALYLRGSRLLFLLNASAAMAIIVFAEPLLRYWISPLYAQKGSVALVLFMTTQAINGASLAVGALSWSAAKAGINLTFSLLNSGVNLLAIYPLASRFGVAGAAAAGLLGALVTPFFIHYVDRHILHVSSLSVLRRCYLPTAVGAAVVAVGSRLLLIPLAQGLASTFALLCFSAALSMVVSGLLGAISKDELHSLALRANSYVDRALRRS
jgi:O-antigen/teichoic acid export membrane protein